jgi:hypothetical protein
MFRPRSASEKVNRMLPVKLAAAHLLAFILFCGIAPAQQTAASSDLPTSPQPTLYAKLEPASPFTLDEPAASSSSNNHYVRSVPGPLAALEQEESTPFHSITIGLTASTLGAGIEFATPVAFNFKLRSSVNVLTFALPFTIHGVNYASDFHFKSDATTLDWYPRHGGFRVSPGILYFKNSANAVASVGLGQNFELGSQPFLNSVDDPVNGTMSTVYHHEFAPMVSFGFRNIVPFLGRHISMPLDFGLAFTGAPQIVVNLTGTACTDQGCVSFGSNSEAQSSLKAEITSLNNDLKSYPVYPIASLGFAYRF